MKNENTKLKTELELLRRALKRLEVDKISLMTIEKELKERCEGLELEVCALKKAVPSKTSSAKSSDTEDSDHSDNTQGTTDSGRSSFKVRMKLEARIMADYNGTNRIVSSRSCPWTHLCCSTGLCAPKNSGVLSGGQFCLIGISCGITHGPKSRPPTLGQWG